MLKLKYTDLLNGTTRADIVHQTAIGLNFGTPHRTGRSSIFNVISPNTGKRILQLISSAYTDFNQYPDDTPRLFVGGDFSPEEDRPIIITNKLVNTVKYGVEQYNKSYLQWKLDNL